MKKCLCCGGDNGVEKSVSQIDEELSVIYGKLRTIVRQLNSYDDLYVRPSIENIESACDEINDLIGSENIKGKL